MKSSRARFVGGEAKRRTILNDEFGNDGGDVIECMICCASSHVEFCYRENLNLHWNTRATNQDFIRRDDPVLRRVMDAASELLDNISDSPDGNVQYCEAYSEDAAELHDALAAMQELIGGKDG